MLSDQLEQGTKTTFVCQFDIFIPAEGNTYLLLFWKHMVIVCFENFVLVNKANRFVNPEIRSGALSLSFRRFSV